MPGRYALPIIPAGDEKAVQCLHVVSKVSWALMSHDEAVKFVKTNSATAGCLACSQIALSDAPLLSHISPLGSHSVTLCSNLSSCHTNAFNMEGLPV